MERTDSRKSRFAQQSIPTGQGVGSDDHFTFVSSTLNPHATFNVDFLKVLFILFRLMLFSDCVGRKLGYALPMAGYRSERASFSQNNTLIHPYRGLTARRRAGAGSLDVVPKGRHRILS